MSAILSSLQARKMRSDVNFQISRAGLSHPARVLNNQIACFAEFYCSYYIIKFLAVGVKADQLKPVRNDFGFNQYISS